MGQEYDSPWKEALEHFFPDFLLLLFPRIHAQIEWSQGYELCNSELAKLAPDSERGHREADVLVKVTRRDGLPMRVLVHVEVQNQEDPLFTERMMVYHYRIFDRYREPLGSRAVLDDTHPKWRPKRHLVEVWDTRFQLEFPVVKLEDYRPEIRALELSDNPFGPIVAAHLHTRSSGPDSDKRRLIKFRMLRQLLESGHNSEQIKQLLRLLDWLLSLSARQAGKLRKQIEKYEKEKGMTYITTFEQMGLIKGIEQGMQKGLEQGMQRGLEQGMQRGIQKGLEAGRTEGLRSSVLLFLEGRFGSVGQVASRLAELDFERLSSLPGLAARVSSLEEFEQQLHDI